MPIPKPIAIYNYKGGVGKSTIATNLADVAASYVSTCVVDCDPQCTASFYMLGITGAVECMREQKTTKRLLDWIRTGENLPRAANSLTVCPSGWKSGLICGDMNLTELEMQLVLKGIGPAQRIWRSLWGLNYEDFGAWPIIDCSPSYSFFTIAATCCASGGIYIPVTTEEDSLYGINLTARSIDQVTRAVAQVATASPKEGSCKIRGIVGNRVLPAKRSALLAALQHTVNSARGAFPDSFAENFKILETMLPEDAQVPPTRAARRSIKSYAPRGPSSKAYEELYLEISSLASTRT